MSFIQSIREKVNLAIYDSKEKVLTNLRALSFIVSLIAIGTLIYYYGFPTSLSTREVLLAIIKSSFVFYVIRYLIRLFYTFEMAKFLKSTWFEGLLMLYLLVEGISYNFFGTLVIQEFCVRLGFESSLQLTTIFIQFYFLLIVGTEIGKVTDIIPRIKLHPAHLFLLTFLAIILLGTIFLLLPEMTIQEGSMPFIDALFTATSAVTVTGLIVVDTATYFTFKGHFLIMVLMKLGALNVIAFGTFFVLMSKFGIGVKQSEMMEDFIGKKSLMSSGGLLGKIIIWSIAIEIIGALMIYPFWSDEIPFKNTGEKVFYTIFHSISAFNNAGFSLFTNGFYNGMIRYSYLFHIAIIILMFLGSLGMMPIFNMFSLSNIRGRIKLPWKQLDFSTKIALYFTTGIVIVTMVVFYLLERNNTLQDKNFLEAMITSLFHAITPRSIGFNTVNIAQCTVPMLLIFLFLMFVGAASGSSGGGIRTSSFALLYAAARATITGKHETELFKRTIPDDLIFKAFSVFMYFVVGIFVGVLLLSFTETHILAQENRTILDIIFEEISAFTTTGLSTGITSELSGAGKLIAVVSMFIGRVGTLSVIYIFGRKLISTAYKYPEEHILVG